MNPNIRASLESESIKWDTVVFDSNGKDHQTKERFQIETDDLIRQPDTLSSYEAYDRFIERQSQLFDIIKQPQAHLRFQHVDGGSEIALEPFAFYSSPFELPFQYWLLVLVGLSVWLFGVTLFVFRTRFEIASWFILLGGMGILLIALSHSIYANRSFVMDASLLRQLNAVAYFGASLFSCALVSIGCCFPRLLLPKAVISTLFVVVVFLNGLNFSFRWIEWPWHAFHLPFILSFVVGIPLVAYQAFISNRWGQSGKGFSQLIQYSVGSVTLVMIVYNIPVVYGVIPLINDTLSILGLFAIYFAMCFAMMKHGLFDIQEWWRHWFYFWLQMILGGLLISLSIHFYLSGSAFGMLVSLSLLLIPIGLTGARSWSETEFSTDRWLDILLLDKPEIESNDERFQRVCQAVFEPRLITQSDQVHADGLDRKGHSMSICRLDSEGSWILSGKRKGYMLFNKTDFKKLEHLKLLTTIICSADNSVAEKIRQERSRIVRDLHDDVSIHLVTLIHQSQIPESIELARRALDNLREAIYCLDSPGDIDLDDFIDRLEAETRQKLNHANITLEWKLNLDKARSLNVFVSQTLSRVFSELTTNIIKHSGASTVICDLSVTDEMNFVMSDDGHASKPLKWTHGAGINSMIRRVEQCDGYIDWISNPSDVCQLPCGTSVICQLPFYHSEAN